MIIIAVRDATSRTAHQLLHPSESEFSSVDLFEIVLLPANMPGILCQSGDIIFVLCLVLSQPCTVRIYRFLITTGGIVDLLVFELVKNSSKQHHKHN